MRGQLSWVHFRAVTAPTEINGNPIVPACDTFGNSWVHLLAGSTVSPVTLDVVTGGADNITPPFNALDVGAFNYGFDGTNWDRIRSFAANADNVAAPTLGLLGTAGFLFGFDGTTYDRLRSDGNSADALAAITAGYLDVNSFPRAFNGTSYDRLRTNAAANIDDTTQPFQLAVAEAGEWAITHAPASNTQATITRAAGAAGVRHVCRSVSATMMCAAGSTPAAVQVNLRDGASGAGTILRSWTVGFGVAIVDALAIVIDIAGLNIFGTAATAMTLEFSAAGGANTFESVGLAGYDTI